MKTKLSVLAILLVAVLRVSADTVDIERKIECGFYRADAALLDEADRELAAALAASPGEPALRYLEGFAAYARTSLAYEARDNKILKTTLEKADSILKTVKGEPWAAEAQGLRGLITGQLISVRGSASAMVLGPKMMTLTSGALERAPASGRTMMFHAVTLHNTPEAFGGDADEALRLLERAVAAFEKTPVRDGAVSWGHAYALNWLAQVRLKKGDFVGAKSAAEQALVVEPDYKVVRKKLLPAIEKKIAGRS